MLFCILLTSLVTTLVLVPRTTSWALDHGFLDQPDDRKIHIIGTPRLGGIAIMMGLLLTSLLFVQSSPKTWGFLAGAIIIFLTGLYDDLKSLTPRQKLAGQFAAAGAVVLAGRTELSSFGNLFGMGELYLGPLAVPISIFAIVGVINAINLLDGLDGLAAGVCALATSTFAVLAYFSGNAELLALCLALLGALIGFLKYNTHPARIFMGDSGSLLLGYCMGTFSIMLVTGGNQTISQVTPLMVLAIPILDTLFVMGKRVRSGKRIFSPDKSHLHHRLLSLCGDHRTTVQIIHAFCYALCITALASMHLPDHLILTTLLLTYSVLFLAMWQMAIAIGNRNKQWATSRSTELLSMFGHYGNPARKPIKSVMLAIVLLAILIPPQPRWSFGREHAELISSHSSYPAKLPPTDTDDLYSDLTITIARQNLRQACLYQDARQKFGRIRPSAQVQRATYVSTPFSGFIQTGETL
ncbi:MAG: hypothetical protein A2076_02535 [Geobacteraceae bacterium GWC2_53_11]|nr:MAG: hypothetical protein A2076_02535 [Geobacteraceae bacterium GWC2_53_11]